MVAQETETVPQAKKAKAERKNYEINAEDKYESKDKKGVWWKVTLLDNNPDGTYHALVHDGTRRIWPVVYERNIRELGPRIPYQGEPDVVWDKAHATLTLNATSEQPIALKKHATAKGIVLPTHHTTPETVVVYNKATRVFPECSRAYVHLISDAGTGVARTFKIPMQSPQYAIYPLMRLLFDVAGVEHNLGPELPDTIEQYEKHVSKKGFVYWHDTEQKTNQWKEPPEEATAAAFEKQLEVAIAQSLAAGVRDKSETDEEKARLQQRLKERGYVEVQVAQDGHCQFRSIAHCVKGDDNLHGEVRKEVMDYIKRNKDVYVNFVEVDLADYCKDMLSGNMWGDHVTLVAAANHYNIKVDVITSNELGCKTIMPRYVIPTRLLGCKNLCLAFCPIL